MHCTVKPGMYCIEGSSSQLARRLRGGASAELLKVAQTKVWSGILPPNSYGVKQKSLLDMVVRLR